MRFLSHKITHFIPAYGSALAKVELWGIKSISKGDSCQTYWIGMENHWGTHIDCPAHFFADGRRVTDYDDDFWMFYKPQVLHLDLKQGQILGKKDLVGKITSETDILLLKSGWGKYRGQEIYSLRNPGLEPELGLWLRKEYPLLKVIGLDWISLSSYIHREIGREAHRVFLDPEGYGHPILIIEDMNLSGDLAKLRKVLVAPLRVEGIDSAPCTVIGVFE